MVKIFRYLNKQYWLFIVLAASFVALSVWFDLRLPGYMSDITVMVQTDGYVASDIWGVGWRMLRIAFLGMIAMAIVGYLSARIAAGFARDLRERVFDKVMDFSAAEVNQFSVASLITRATNDVTQVQNIIVIGFQTVVRSPILAIWATIKIFDRGFEWSVATMVSVGIMMSFIFILVIFALPKLKIVQDLTDKLNLVTRQHLTGIRVVKAYNAKAYEEAKFADANEELIRTNRFVQRMMSSLWPLIGFIMQALPLILYVIGMYLIQGAALPADRVALFGDMIVFAQYGMMILMAFLMMSFMFVLLPQAVVSARRINEVLHTDLSLLYPDAKTLDPDSNVAIEFKNVDFKYPDAGALVLEDINFTINKGQTVALIGATGSGKSTVVKLMTRGYDATTGDVNILGKAIKQLTKVELTQKIGYAPQKATLFTGTVASNVAFGQTVNANLTPQIKEASLLAQASEFIEKLENTYEANITQGGTNVSGGQKQRLGIARTLFNQPPILIFDDSFSALDYKTDRKLREALEQNCQAATKVIVAQRVSSIKNSDKIIVMDEGRVAGIGTHDALMKSCSVYSEIAYSQLTEEELANG